MEEPISIHWVPQQKETENACRTRVCPNLGCGSLIAQLMRIFYTWQSCQRWTTYLRWKTQMSNFPQLLQCGRAFWADYSASVSKVLLRPEQMSMLWTKHVICRSTISGGLFMNCWAGTFLTAKASMFLQQHRRFAGHYLDSECVISIFT